MADRITITPSELRDASTQFTNKADEIDQILSDLKSLVSSLESTWDGAAQDQFFVMYNEMHPEFVRIAEEVLPGIATTLTSVADTLEETDERIASSLQGN